MCSTLQRQPTTKCANPFEGVSCHHRHHALPPRARETRSSWGTCARSSRQPPTSQCASTPRARGAYSIEGHRYRFFIFHETNVARIPILGLDGYPRHREAEGWLTTMSCWGKTTTYSLRRESTSVSSCDYRCQVLRGSAAATRGMHVVATRCSNRTTDMQQRPIQYRGVSVTPRMRGQQCDIDGGCSRVQGQGQAAAPAAISNNRQPSELA